ncbi:cysteine protease StiP family protein [Mesorhizobium sp. M0808]|uniref:cysteine protease StiP domain-containing protein n=1 Tax=unclassified Mesorhizobium TaxID=325217 RepID=UPI00333B6AD1
MKTQSKFISGTYHSADITFLLKLVNMEAIDVASKEAAIQSGQRHYSEMISFESAPEPGYMAIFDEAMSAGAARMGREVAALARSISNRIDGPITLASLVRAGVPLGVLLKRALSRIGRDVEHFGISIIRDRGIDGNAMRHILDRRPIEGLLFVDGWTGKGAISTELEESFRSFSAVAPKLVVLADPCGRAWLAASGEDWLIPSGILGSTVSGLISRSILNENVTGPEDFHGTVRWDHLEAHDISAAFVDQVWTHTVIALDRNIGPAQWTDDERSSHQRQSREAINRVAAEFEVENLNRIKPGIAEATRAILRRMPQMVFLSSIDDAEPAALLHLIREKNVPFKVVPEKIHPYRAITLIQKVSKIAEK